MGVYINMEMPKNCFQCSFNDGIYCALIDNDTDAFISEDPTKVSTKRLDNCPLIEIDDTVWENEKYKLIRMTEEQRVNKKLTERRADVYESDMR